MMKETKNKETTKQKLLNAKEIKEKATKKQQGISIVALVVTIIVLLILASIALSTITGNNGIFNKTKETEDETEKVEVTALVQLEALQTYTEKDGFNSESFKAKVYNHLAQYNPKINENDDVIIVTIRKHDVVVDKMTGDIVDAPQTSTGAYPKIETAIYQINGEKIEQSKIYDEVILTINITNNYEFDTCKITLTDKKGNKIEANKNITGKGQSSHTILRNGAYLITAQGIKDGEEKISRKTIYITSTDSEVPNIKIAPNGGADYVMPTTGKATIKTEVTSSKPNKAAIAYEYAWSTSSTETPTEWQKTTSIATITKTDFTEGSYYLWVKVSDEKEILETKYFTSEAFTINSNTSEVGKIQLTPNKKEPTNKDVTVTATYGEKLTQNRTLTCTGTENVDYIIKGTNSIEVITNGQTITASATDIAGNKVTETIKITNIDKIIPTVSVTPNGGNHVIPVEKTTINISAKLTATDEGGSKLNKLEYAWSTSNTEEPQNGWKTFTNESTITDAIPGGTHYLWTKVTDAAENRAEEGKVSDPYVVKYQIKYNANGGTGEPEETIKEHDKNLTLSTKQPTRTGYTFIGWSTNKNATKEEYKAGETYSANSAKTLYAIWEANQYTVTLDNQSATTAGTTAVYERYEKGIYLDSAETKEMTTTANPITVPQRAYTVTYNYNGNGTANNSATATYTFGGYYTEANGGGTQRINDKGYITSNFANTSYSANGTLYAKWTSASVTLPTPTRTGYTFAGWYTEATGGTKVGAAGASYTPTAGITLYAQWTINSYTVTYNYSENGGTSATKTSATVNYNASIDLTPTASKDGYTFVGWNTNKDATSKLSTLTMGANDVTLYAIYSKTVTATCNYYNGQVATASSTMYNKATSISVTLPTIANQTVSSVTYTGRGWSTSTGADATIAVASGGSVTLSNNATYYASYEATITGTFYYCTLAADNYTYSGAAQKSATATAKRYMTYKGEMKYTNYTIPTAVTGSTGGASAQNYAGVATSANNATTITPTTANTAFYAVYTESLTLYYYNGSAHTNKTVTRRMLSNGTTYGNSLSETITPSSYDSANFVAWTYDATQYGTDYRREPLATGTNTLYAIYQKTITGTFNYYNGSAKTSAQSSATRTYISKSGGVNTYNVNYTLPTITNLSGYTQRGWSTTDGATAGTTTPTTANTTFYMSYSYGVTVTYNVNGGSSTAPTAASGTSYMKYDGTKTGISVTISSTTPTKTGYTFAGKWNTVAGGTGTSYTSGTAYTFTASATIYAQWTINTYKAEFRSNLISNGQFANGSTGWNLSNYGTIDTTVKNGTQNTIRVTSSNSGWDGIQTSYNVTYKPNTQYKITLKAYRNSSSTYGNLTRDFRVYLPEHKSDGTLINYRHYITINASNLPDKTWKEFTATFTTDASGSIFGTLNADFNATTGTTNIWLADIKVEEIQTKSVTYSSALGTLPTTTRTNYTFGGWFTGENGTGTQITTNTTMGASDAIYYANWTANQYTVTLNNQSATTAGSTAVYERYATGIYLDTAQTKAMTTTANAITVPQRAYTVTYNYNGNGTSNNSVTATYTFGGYYTSTGGGGTQRIAANGYITSNFTNTSYSAAGTLYAKWTGGITLPTPTRTGYTFAGWYTAASGGTKVGAGGANYAPTAAITLYAQWTINSYTIDLNMTVDGTAYNSGYNDLIYVGLKIGGVDKGYVKDYCTSHTYGTAWEIYGIKINGTTLTYSSKGTLGAGNKDLRLTFYTMTFTANSGTYGSVSTGSYIVWSGQTYSTSGGTLTLGDGRKVTASTKSVTGYTSKFTGWSSASGTVSAKTTITANFTGTANQYTITLNTQGATTAGSTAVYERYATGIYLDTAQTKAMTTSANPITKPEKVYSVTYNFNGNGTANSTVTTKCTYGGYYTSTGGGGTQMIGANGYITSNFKNTSYSANGTLYAKWSSAAAITLPTPTRTGYTFAGWYTAASGGTKVGAAGASYTPTAGITLYAQWTDNIKPTINTYAGAMLYTDPSFASGNNSIVVYNNSANGTVTHTRKAMSDNPAGSGYGIEIKTTGTASPGHGGFYFATPTAANKEFITRIVAKIPVGYNINWYSNAYGTTGQTTQWLTSQAGTGQWQEYAFRVKCGSNGSFSSTNFFALTGGSTATTAAPVTWQVGYATVIDTSKWATTNYIITVATDYGTKVSAYGQNQSSSTAPSYSTFTANANMVKISGALTANGTYYSWVKDAAGNVINKATAVNYIDRTAPGAVTITYNGGANSCSWKNNYKLTLSATDSQSGISTYQIDTNNDGVANSTTGSSFTPGNGYNSCSVRFRAVDNAGNAGAWTAVQHIHMDTQAPGAVTVTYNGGANSCSWKNNYNLTLSASDNIGISTYQIDTNNDGAVDGTTGSNFIPGNGYSSCNVRFRAVDHAGNAGPWTAVQHIHMDTQAPGAVTVTYNSGANSCSWKNNYNYTLSASDNVGIAGYQIDWEGNGTVNHTTSSNFIPWNNYSSCNTRFRAVDHAGNVGPWSESHHIHMDTEAPSKTTVNLNGYSSGSWTSGNVTQTASATDNIGISYYQYSHDGVNVAATFPNPWTITWDGWWNFYVRAVDHAGNAGPWSDMYNINRTVYQINNPTYVTYACSLEEAINRSENNATIYLLKDFSDGSTASIYKNLTISTNGKTLTRTAQTTINSGYTVAIAGSGTLKAGANIHLIWNSGTLNITHTGTIQGISTSGYWAVANVGTANKTGSGTISGYFSLGGDGTTNVSAGTVTATASGGRAIHVGTPGSLKITGGTISASGSGQYPIVNHGTANISGATVTASTAYSTIYNTGTLTTTSGTYTNTGTYDSNIGNPSAAIVYNSGTANLNGGTFSRGGEGRGICNDGTVNISGITLNSTTSWGGGILNHATANIYSGTFTTSNRVLVSNKKSLNITGGSFTTTASAGSGQVLVNSGDAIIKGGTFKNTNASSTSPVIHNYDGRAWLENATVESSATVEAINNHTNKAWTSGTCTVLCSLHIAGTTVIKNTGTGFAILQPSDVTASGAHTPKSYTGKMYSKSTYVVKNNSSGFMKMNGGTYYSPSAKYSGGTVSWGSGARKVKGSI